MGGFLPPKPPAPPTPGGPVSRQRLPQGGPVWRRQQQDRAQRRGGGQPPPITKTAPPPFKGMPQGMPGPGQGGPWNDFPQRPPSTGGPDILGRQLPGQGPFNGGEVFDPYGSGGPFAGQQRSDPNMGLPPGSVDGSLGRLGQRPPLMGGVPRGGIMGGQGIPRGNGDIFGNPYGGFGG